VIRAKAKAKSLKLRMMQRFIWIAGARRAVLKGAAYAALWTALCGIVIEPTLLLAQQPSGVQAATPQPAQKINPNAKKKPASYEQRADAEKKYVEGAKALAAGDAKLAEKNFVAARALDPDNQDYALAVDIAKQHEVISLVRAAALARKRGKSADADRMLDEAAKIDPGNEVVKQHELLRGVPLGLGLENQGDDREANRVAAAKLLATVTLPNGTSEQWRGPAQLEFNGQKHSFHERDNIRTMIAAVLKQYGINAVYDESVPAHVARLDVDDLTGEQIVPLMDEVLNVFLVPLGPHQALVARDAPELHERLDPEVYETVYLPGLSPDDLKATTQVAQQVYGIKAATVNTGNRTLSVRGPEETVAGLNRTLADLMDNDSEVLLDVSLYEIDQSNMRQIGIQPPQTVSMFNFDSEVEQVVQANQSTINQAIAAGLVTQGNLLQYAELLFAAGLLSSTVFGQAFALFGGGLTRTGVTGVTSTLNVALNASDSRMLDESAILAENKQPGTFRAGEKYPITTSAFSNLAAAGTSGISTSGLNASELALLGLSGVSSLASGTTAIIPQIQYEDIGLTLKTTPVISRDGSITLKFDMKLESLAGGTVDGIPILNNRAYQGDVTVADGQTAVIMSEVTRSEIGSISGTPGISELPGFSDIADRTSNYTGQKVVMLVRPHLVRRVDHIYAGDMVMLEGHPTSPARVEEAAPPPTPTLGNGPPAAGAGGPNGAASGATDTSQMNQPMANPASANPAANPAAVNPAGVNPATGNPTQSPGTMNPASANPAQQ